MALPSLGAIKCAATAILASMIALLTATCALAQEAQSPRVPDDNRPVHIHGEPVYRVGGGVSAPRPIYTPDPEYSEEARRAVLQGTCVLWMVIGADGKTYDVRIARSLGMGLDEKSIEAIRNWRFEPATKDGQPVPVQMNVETNFRLYPPPQSSIPAVLDPLPGKGSQPFQLSAKNAARYPLVVDVRFVMGKQTEGGYVVNAEATLPEGEQPHKITVSCGPKAKCFMLNQGRYPARWMNTNEMELIGTIGRGKWLKAQFLVVPIVENRR